MVKQGVFALALCFAIVEPGCASRRVATKPAQHHRLRLWDGNGREVNLREEALKKIPEASTLAPEMLQAFRVVSEYRRKHQGSVLRPNELSLSNFVVKLTKGMGFPRFVEIEFHPLPPPEAGIEWWDSTDERAAWYKVDVVKESVEQFSFCYETRDPNCPPKRAGK